MSGEIACLSVVVTSPKVELRWVCTGDEAFLVLGLGSPGGGVALCLPGKGEAAWENLARLRAACDAVPPRPPVVEKEEATS